MTVTPGRRRADRVGLTAEQIGATAASAGITVLELTAEQASLEDAFVDLTKNAVEYRAARRGEIMATTTPPCPPTPARSESPRPG